MSSPPLLPFSLSPILLPAPRESAIAGPERRPARPPPFRSARARRGGRQPQSTAVAASLPPGGQSPPTTTLRRHCRPAGPSGRRQSFAYRAAYCCRPRRRRPWNIPDTCWRISTSTSATRPAARRGCPAPVCRRRRHSRRSPRMAAAVSGPKSCCCCGKARRRARP